MNYSLPARIQYVDDIGRQFVTPVMDFDTAWRHQWELVAQGYKIIALERLTDRCAHRMSQLRVLRGSW